MDNQEQHVVILQDESGADVKFEHLMTLQHNGSYYVLLEAVEDMDDCMEGEAVILKIIRDDQGQDMYATIEDEQELQEVFDKCIAAMEEQDAVEEGQEDTEDAEE